MYGFFCFLCAKNQVKIVITSVIVLDKSYDGVVVATSISVGTQQARENLQQQLQQQLSVSAAVTTATPTVRTVSIVQQGPQPGQITVQMQPRLLQPRVVQQVPQHITVSTVRNVSHATPHLPVSPTV